jgi:hypothetical protein
MSLMMARFTDVPAGKNTPEQPSHESRKGQADRGNHPFALLENSLEGYDREESRSRIMIAQTPLP